MGMGFAPTWLRHVSPPASQNHFNHCFKLFPPQPTSIRRLLDGHSTAHPRSFRSRCRKPLAAVMLTCLFIYLFIYLCCSAAAWWWR